MRYCFSCLLLLFNLSSFGQNYQFGDTLYVWNLDGANIVRHPVEERGSLLLIGHGEFVEVVDKDLKAYPSAEMIYDLKLDGYWVQILFEDQIGYVFDGHLVNADPNIRFEHEKDRVLLQRILGKVLSSTSNKRTIKTSDTEYDVMDEISNYESGKYTYTPFDGCFNHTYEVRDRRFSEVYQLMMNLYSERFEPSNEYFDVRPKLEDRKPGVLTFSGVEATAEIRITFKKDGGFDIFSYDCD